MGRLLNKYGVWLLLVVNCIFVFWNKSTYDDGDSIVHYLLSRQAMDYPSQLLNHWGKPVFILLSTLPAQLGFVGIKIFNTLCVLLSLWFAQKIVQRLSRPATPLIWLLGLFAPHVFLSQSSGLTEPLFALFLIAGIWLIMSEKWINSMILLSFLPFIRSEGWVILIVFAIVGMIRKKWKVIPWLAFGTILYGIIGLVALNDFLWMFHQNPYSGTEPKYGHGNLTHFVQQLPYLLGWPVCALLTVGLFSQARKAWQNRLRLTDFQLLVTGTFLALLVAHSIFWAMGWFHSFGLKRVLLAVFPGMILIAHEGLIYLSELFKSKKSLVKGILVAVVIAFPFSGNKAGFSIPADFQLTPAQVAVEHACDWYLKEFEGSRTVSFGHYQVALELGLDIDDPTKFMSIDAVLNNSLPQGTIVFWDDYFSMSDRGVSEEDLDNDRYHFHRKFVVTQHGKTSCVAVYEKK